MEPTRIIKKPLITEKSTFMSAEWNRYVFQVDRRATKPQIRKAVERQSPFRVWGRGIAVRDFIHARDIARGTLHMLEHHAECDPVHVATGRSTSINELVGIILKCVGSEDVEIVHDTSAPEGPAVKRIDLTKMRKLGFEPKISLEDGVRETLEWFRARQA